MSLPGSARSASVPGSARSGQLSSRPIDPNTGFNYNSLFIPGHNRSLHSATYMPKYTGHVPCAYKIDGSKLSVPSLRKAMIEMEQARYPDHGRRRQLSLPRYMPGYTGFVPYADQIIARRSHDVAPEALKLRKVMPQLSTTRVSKLLVHYSCY